MIALFVFMTKVKHETRRQAHVIKKNPPPVREKENVSLHFPIVEEIEILLAERRPPMIYL